MQTTKVLGEILSRNHRFLRPGIRLVMPYHCTYLRRLRSNLLNTKFGSQKSALLLFKSHNFSET